MIEFLKIFLVVFLIYLAFSLKFRSGNEQVFQVHFVDSNLLSAGSCQPVVTAQYEAFLPIPFLQWELGSDRLGFSKIRSTSKNIQSSQVQSLSADRIQFSVPLYLVGFGNYKLSSVSFECSNQSVRSVYAFFRESTGNHDDLKSQSHLTRVNLEDLPTYNVKGLDPRIAIRYMSNELTFTNPSSTSNYGFDASGVFTMLTLKKSEHLDLLKKRNLLVSQDKGTDSVQSKDCQKHTSSIREIFQIDKRYDSRCTFKQDKLENISSIKFTFYVNQVEGQKEVSERLFLEIEFCKYGKHLTSVHVDNFDPEFVSLPKAYYFYQGDLVYYESPVWSETYLKIYGTEKGRMNDDLKSELPVIQRFLQSIQD